MADTARTRAALVTLLADNSTGAISAQDLRDFLASVAISSDPQDVKVYRARLTQTGTDNPVENQVYENSLSDDVVWTRIAEGVFNCTLSGEFLEAKTYVSMNSLTISINAVATRVTDNLVAVIGMTAASGISADVETFSIEIIVYP